MKNKRLLLISILMLTIGFAALTTVLLVNGTIFIEDDSYTFIDGVIFTKATTDTGGKAIISQDGKTITFLSTKLKKVNDKATLDFEITNYAENYDANATIECLDENDSKTNDYITFVTDAESYTINSGETTAGKLTVTYSTGIDGEKEIGLTCKITATAVDRDTNTVTKGTDNTFSGYILDENGDTVTSGYLAVYSNEKKIISIGETGKVEINNLEDGTHEMYYLTASPTDLTKSQIKAQAIASGKFTTSMTNPVIELEGDEHSYTIAPLYNVTFVTTNATVSETSIKVSYNGSNKVTVTPSGYLKSVTCTNGYTTNALTGTSATSAQEITISNNGNSNISVCTIVSDYAGFNGETWDQIVKNIRNNDTVDYTVGTTAKVYMGSTFGVQTVRLANNSNYDCTLESKTACGFVIEFVDILSTYNMNNTVTNVGGWPASSMYTYVNTTIYNALPSDLKSVILDTDVVSGHGSSESSNFTSTDKLYLLALKEISGSSSSDTAESATRQLDYYANSGTTIKKSNGSAIDWWLRSVCSSSTSDFFYVRTNGAGNNNTATCVMGVSPAFRIG